MNKRRDIERLARRAVPSLNRVRAAFDLSPVAKLDLRCRNSVSVCPVAKALKGTRLGCVYSEVLSAETADDADVERGIDTAPKALRVVSRVWRKPVQRMKKSHFCCHRHFDESELVVRLPRTVGVFVRAFIDWDEAGRP